jgi:hypothetical protein
MSDYSEYLVKLPILQRELEDALRSENWDGAYNKADDIRTILVHIQVWLHDNGLIGF